jgi:hypothetical protein
VNSVDEDVPPSPALMHGDIGRLLRTGVKAVTLENLPREQIEDSKNPAFEVEIFIYRET